MSAAAIRQKLRALADPQQAAHARRFFRTGPGEYGEGDRFLGIRVPELRHLARVWARLPRRSTLSLLHSPWHEERLLALLILVGQYQRGSDAERKAIYRLYLDSTDHINNWDLVDVSAPHIVGVWLWQRPRKALERLAASDSLWERRIAVLATFHFIRQGDFADTLRLCARLLDDPHDLIHKACGWMLREVGKRDQAALEDFLRRYHGRMPRTMLRYAIERLPETHRQAWLRGGL